MKKIMFLGASGAMYDVVEHAKRRGIYTIVIDWYKNSPAKRIADRSYLASTTDVDLMIRIARENEIDGIFTGFSDANLMPARKVADALGLPFYATERQIEITTDKLKFKQICREHQIPVVPEYCLDDALKREDLDKIQYPVILKPADSWASKGVSVCKNEKELLGAVQNALHFSKSKRLIVEKYMIGYPDICMYFNIQNGELSLSAMCERDLKLVEEGRAKQPNALFFPCRYIGLYDQQLQKKISALVKTLDMCDGTMFMQGFVVDGKIMPFEMGYRFCGASEYILCAKENGIDSCEMMLEYALTGKAAGWDAKTSNQPLFRHSDAILLVLLRPGTISKIEGLEKIKKLPEVIHIIQFYYEGDSIRKDAMATLNQTFSRIFIQAENNQKLLNVIAVIQDALNVYDINGEDMILPGYDCKKGNILKILAEEDHVAD